MSLCIGDVFVFNDADIISMAYVENVVNMTNKIKYQKFSFENYHFYSREILQYIARTCLRNAVSVLSSPLTLCLPVSPAD